MLLVAAALFTVPARAESRAGSGLAGFARARWARPHGFELGLRVGYGVPEGRIADAPVSVPSGGGLDLSDVIQGQVPIWIDAGYRLPIGLYLGGYAEIGPGISSQCEPPDCNIFDLRLGANARYHFLAGRRIEPWVGVDLGYELLYSRSTIRVLGAQISSSLALHGFEFFNAQVGVDFRVTPEVVLAPFFTCALSQYEQVTARVEENEVSTSDFDKAIHLWLLFGVRGAYNFGH